MQIEVIKELFESFLFRYQIGLETSTKGSDFIFDGVNLLYYKCRKINFKRDGSYRESPDRIESKKATINLKYKSNKYFQYAAMVALSFDEIKKDPQRVWNIKAFTNKYNWDGINYSSKIDA